LEFEPFYYDTLCFRHNLIVNKQTPDYLYHYTTARGFLGILQSNEDNYFQMWASDSRYLNDSLEYVGGLKIAEECLNSSQYKLSHLNQQASNLLKVNNGRIAVLSMSSKEDLLSQWRAYSENGGYSIKINTDLFKDIDSHCSNNYLAKCIYSKTELIVKINNCIEWHNKQFTKSTINCSQEVIDYHLNYCLSGLVGTIRNLATLFKHDSFSEESEWRYVVTYPQENKFNIRSANGLLIPYICLKFPEKSIVQVTVAPSSREQLAKCSAEDVLAKYIKNCTATVQLSDTSFRW